LCKLRISGISVAMASQRNERENHIYLALQLRKRWINKVIVAEMSANLCTASHMRELVEQDFEVAVVRDATATAKVPEGDGYQAGVVNFRFIASAV